MAINNDLSKLDTWLQGNKLTLNVAKTHSMLIATKQKHKMLKCQNEELDLKICNKKLDIVQATKYLPLQIDSSLDWKKQIKAVSTKVSRAVRFEICKVLPAKGILKNSLYGYSGASLLVLLLCIGLLRFNGNYQIAKTSRSCCKGNNKW